MLTFIGLGLFDEYDVSVRGLDAIRNADTVFLEVYTSVLMGSSIERLEEYYCKKITPLYREDVEIHSDKIINAAKEGDAVPEWPKGADCKSVVSDFGGSNPPPPTKITQVKRLGFFF